MTCVYCRNIPGYISKVPVPSFPSFDLGGDAGNVEFVEFDANDNEGWVAVPETAFDTQPSGSGWGLPGLPGLPKLPTIIKAQVSREILLVSFIIHSSYSFRLVLEPGLSM